LYVWHLSQQELKITLTSKSENMFIEPYLGTVTIFAGNFAPQSWMLCNGQLLSIAEYDALFALLGTTYGGDGQSTFALPDLRSRVAVHPGQGQGLSPISLGQVSGNESATLLPQNLGIHTHPLLTITGKPGCSTTAGNKNMTTSNVPAITTNINSYTSGAGTANMGPTTCNTATPVALGSNMPIDTRSPVMAMNYIIAVEGIFPSRN
jgi:microcystin-dependent protein